MTAGRGSRESTQPHQPGRSQQPTQSQQPGRSHEAGHHRAPSPNGRLAGRIALIVGAGQSPGETIGNGRATAITFAREGARLVLVDRDAGTLAETVDMLPGPRSAGGAPAAGPAPVGAEAAEAATADAAPDPPSPEVITVVADITDDDAPRQIIDAAVAAFGGIDILHNNVGVGGGDGPPHHLDDDVFDRIMQVNLRSTWRICREAVPLLRRSGNGAIVNVSSLAAIAAAGNLTAYKISKAGVNALTQNLAITNAKHGVRANAIMPGFMDTPMGVDAQAMALGVDRAEFAAMRASIVPLGRQGTAWDVANAALFLASDEAGFITGVMLAVDGGQSARVG